MADVGCHIMAFFVIVRHDLHILLINDHGTNIKQVPSMWPSLSKAQTTRGISQLDNGFGACKALIDIGVYLIIQTYEFLHPISHKSRYAHPQIASLHLIRHQSLHGMAS